MPAVRDEPRSSRNGPARVLWLAKGLGRGGAERLLVTSAAHVDRDRFDVQVAYLLPWKDAFVPELEAAGVAVHCLDQRHPADLRWSARLRRLVSEGEFDLVHTHMPMPAAVARTVLSRSVGLVHTEHNVWHRYRRPTYWANALTFRRNDAVVAVSQAVRDSMPTRFLPLSPVRTEVLLHGIEYAAARTGGAARAAARAALGLSDDDFVVGNVANFTPKKDHETLLQAVRRLRAHTPRTRAVLVGTGPLEDALKARVAALGLTDVVQFTGSRDDVLDLLPAFDVFALSSLHEGLSIALVEGLASGVPGVCTRVGGVPEAMRDGLDGLLVPARDPAALSAALQRMADDEAFRAACSRRAREHASGFDIGRAVRRLEGVYDEVLARR